MHIIVAGKCVEIQLVANKSQVKAEMGRPKSNYILTKMEIKELGQPQRCGTCHNVGHNKRKCPFEQVSQVNPENRDEDVTT